MNPNRIGSKFSSNWSKSRSVTDSLFGTNINFYIKNKIFNVPNYIKIDVDGIEHKILRGADECLKSNDLKSVSIELNENYLEQFKEATHIMKSYNFEIKQKKHAKFFDKSELFSNTYNYIFEKKWN